MHDARLYAARSKRYAKDLTCTPFAGQDIETTELARRLMALV